MGFIAPKPSMPAPAPAPVYTPPPAPVVEKKVEEPTGDVTGQDRLRGGAARRRGAGTILSGETTLGATAGKSLLGQ